MQTLVKAALIFLSVFLPAVAFSLAPAHAQIQPKPRRHFELASIKPNNSKRPRIMALLCNRISPGKKGEVPGLFAKS